MSAPLPAMFVEIQAAGRGVGTAAGRMIGRTSVIRPMAVRDGFEWNQEFAFEDLGGMGKEEEVKVVVWKERKMGREGQVGEVVVMGRAGMKEGEM